MRSGFYWHVVLFFFVLSPMAYSGESPQFRGPNRDGHFAERGLLKQRPEKGPDVIWTVKGLGAGYSSPAVRGGKIYVTGMDAEQNGFLSIMTTDGKPERKVPYGKETVEAQAPGSRSTPTLDGDRAYLLSGLGVLSCIDLNKGEKKWAMDFTIQFGSEKPQWHYAESVLIDGDRVIATPGGKDHLVVALDKMTGSTIWTTNGLEDKASYCSPTVIQHNGKRILVTVTGRYVVGIDPEHGGLLWSFEHRAPWDIHGVTPLYKDGLLYYVGGDGSGGGVLALSPDGTAVTSKWTDTTLDCLHHGVVLVDGYLYGTGYKKRQLVCLEMATGKVMWASHSEEVGMGDVIYADGMLYVYEGPAKGVVDLVKASPAGLSRTGRFELTEGDGKHWAHPVLSNGRLYLRHGDMLMAYQVAAKP